MYKYYCAVSELLVSYIFLNAFKVKHLHIKGSLCTKLFLKLKYQALHVKVRVLKETKGTRPLYGVKVGSLRLDIIPLESCRAID